MIPLKRLYLVSGFDDADVERLAAELQRKYVDGSVRFLARPYPVKAEKRATYLKALVQSANDLIFGPGTATNFCRKQDQPCVLEAAKGKAGRQGTCERAKAGETACARSRPQLIVVISADQLFNQVFDKLGRATLILRLPGPRLPPIDALKNEIDAFEPIATAVVSNVTNRNKSVYAALVPDRNFQRLGGHQIAADAQANPACFAATLKQYHERLYRGDFINPKKPGIHGAYMLDTRHRFSGRSSAPQRPDDPYREPARRLPPTKRLSCIWGEERSRLPFRHHERRRRRDRPHFDGCADWKV